MQEILKLIENSRRIVITTHINPDGDGIGSGLALFLALNKLYPDGLKKVRFIIDDSLPVFLEFLEHSEFIENYNIVGEGLNTDLLIAVDSAELERIGDVKKLIIDNTAIINIDHHASNTLFGDYNFVDESVASAAEIIFNLIKKMEIEIDSAIAESIYCGIVNDTGNFVHSNVNSETFKTASELLEYNIRSDKVSASLFHSKSIERIRLTGLALLEMIVCNDKNFGYYYLPYKKLEELGNGMKENTEGIIDSIKSCEDCDVALFMRETKEGKIKGSLRTKTGDVMKIAKIFGGGGHRKAAGFTTDKKYEEVVKIVKENL